MCNTALLLAARQANNQLEQGQLNRSKPQRAGTSKPASTAGNGGQAPTRGTGERTEKNKASNTGGKRKSQRSPRTGTGTGEGAKGRGQTNGTRGSRERDPQARARRNSADTSNRATSKGTATRTPATGGNSEHLGRRESHTEKPVNAASATNAHMRAGRHDGSSKRERGDRSRPHAGTGEPKAGKLGKNIFNHALL